MHTADTKYASDCYEKTYGCYTLNKYKQERNTK
jgi:hypothetical protein